MLLVVPNFDLHDAKCNTCMICVAVCGTQMCVLCGIVFEILAHKTLSVSFNFFVLTGRLGLSAMYRTDGCWSNECCGAIIVIHGCHSRGLKDAATTKTDDEKNDGRGYFIKDPRYRYAVFCEGPSDYPTTNEIGSVIFLLLASSSLEVVIDQPGELLRLHQQWVSCFRIMFLLGGC